MDTLEKKLKRADRLYAITQRIGFVLWQLQELEGCAAQLFVLLAQATKGMGMASGLELVQKAQGKTFGSTVRQLTEAKLLSPELEAEFKTVLTDRNWLVHKSKAENRDAIYSDSAASKLIHRLDTMEQKSKKLLHRLGQIAEEHVKQHGVTEQQINSMSENLLEQWHGANAI